MINKKSLIAFIFLTCFAYNANAEDDFKLGNGKYALGFHSGFATFGVAGRVGITDKISAEALLGFTGILSHYGVRGLYTLKQEKMWKAYGFAGAGLWMWDSGFSSLDSETVLGVSGGAGIEYDWRSMGKELPPITWHLELGLGIVNFDNYNFSSFGMGAGGMYHF